MLDLFSVLKLLMRRAIHLQMKKKSQVAPSTFFFKATFNNDFYNYLLTNTNLLVYINTIKILAAKISFAVVKIKFGFSLEV